MEQQSEKKEGNWNVSYYEEGRNIKTQSSRIDLTDVDSSKWKEKVEGHNGDA